MALRVMVKGSSSVGDNLITAAYLKWKDCVRFGDILEGCVCRRPKIAGNSFGGGGGTQVVFMWLIIAYLFSPLKDAISNLRAWGFHARERKKKSKMIKLEKN